MTIESDIQKLNPGDLVEMYELDTTPLGGTLFRFHPGLSGVGGDVVWQGNTYTRFPVGASGFERTGKGTLPTPMVRVANATGLIGSMCKSMEDLVGARFVRRRTFAKYLDAVNFPGGVNASADPNVHFPDEIWQVNRKSNENKVLVEFELRSAMDVQGVRLPRRQVIANVCPWKYRSTECGYTGTNYFTSNDQVTTAGLDVCGKCLNSCKIRFGAYAELPFGGFPGAGRR